MVQKSTLVSDNNNNNNNKEIKSQRDDFNLPHRLNSKDQTSLSRCLHRYDPVLGRRIFESRRRLISNVLRILCFKKPVSTIIFVFGYMNRQRIYLSGIQVNSMMIDLCQNLLYQPATCPVHPF